MNTSLEQFIRDSIQRARTDLSYQDALEYLRRTMVAFEDRVEEISRFHSTVMNLMECDRQLVLIADGQLRLNLADNLYLPVLRTPAERLQWARRHRHVTLARLAGKTGIPLTRISEFTQGRRIPPADAPRLEEALDLPPTWLLTGAEKPLLQAT